MSFWRRRGSLTVDCTLVARVERVDVRVELANQEEDMVYGVSCSLTCCQE